ncbi:hypothetical protein TNCV_3310441 [Trichonephila clavipes]|nr:hypothetical protein TNCV_3310441 [Trichonephila clavipes]
MANSWSHLAICVGWDILTGYVVDFEVMRKKSPLSLVVTSKSTIQKYFKKPLTKKIGKKAVSPPLNEGRVMRGGGVVQPKEESRREARGGCKKSDRASENQVYNRVTKTHSAVEGRPVRFRKKPTGETTRLYYPRSHFKELLRTT